MNSHRLPRTTRRILLALTCAAALASPMLAQDPSAPPPPQQQGGPGAGGPEMQQKRLDHMTKALNLTPDQASQIKAIQDDGRQQMMAMRNDTSTSGPDRHAKMMAMRDAQDAKIKAVLNDDQKTKYDAMQAKAHERREQHGAGDQAPPPPPPAV